MNAEQILQIFSTREVAIIIWAIILLFASLFIKGIPEILGDFLKIIGSKIVLIFTLISAIYTALIVFLLCKLCLWDITFLKDTCIWFVFSSIAITFNVHKARNFSFFKKIIKDNITLILFFEFAINFYTFSLPIELVTVPIISFISIIHGFAEISQKQNPSHHVVVSCFGKILSILSVGVLIFIIYKTVTDYENFFTILNLKSFLLPINLTLLSLPFFYGLALYLEYDSLFTVIKHRWKKSPSVSKKLMIATLLYANGNINKLSRVWKHHSFFNSDKESPYSYIKRLANKPKYIIGSNAKLSIFNDIARVLKSLSTCGLGELEEWMMKGGDYYHSSSLFYQFKSADKGTTDNSMQYLLTGEETYINQIDIMLNLGLDQDHKQALTEYRDLVIKTLEALEIAVPDKLTENIAIFKDFCDDLDNYIVTLKCTRFEEIGWCTLTIETKLYDSPIQS